MANPPLYLYRSPMLNIHPTAIVSANAHLADDVTVGPFAIIDSGVTIGAGCKVGARSWITGKLTQIGINNKIGCGAIIGDDPQDTSFDPSTPSGVIVGDNNRIGDYVTLHRSTAENGNTVVGDGNFIMIGVHIGHDTVIGDNNNIANNVLLGGHIRIGNNVFLGAGAAFHQFIYIGNFAIVQGNAALSRDIPPFCMAHGQNGLAGLNVIGLRRGGFNPAERSDIKRAYKLLFRSGGNLKEALLQSENSEWTAGAQQLLDAARNPSSKGLLSR